MSEQVATAQPEATPAPAANAVSDMGQPPAAAPTVSELPKLTLDEILSQKYDEVTAAPPEKEAPPEVKSDQPTNGTTEPASSPAIGPPHTWSADYHGKWSSLPPDVQKYIADRESQTHTKISQQGNELKSFQPLRGVLDQFQGYYPPGQEAQFIQQLAMANAALHNSPGEVLAELARYYNVDLTKLANGHANGSQPPPTNGVDDLFKDPRVDQLKAEHAREIAELKSYVRQLGGHVSAREHAEAQQRHTAANETIAAFSKDKADWADLESDIIREVKVVKEENPRLAMDKVLEQAYDRARWANPSVRQRILDAERKTEADKAEAKKFAATNVRTGAPASTATVAQKWDDDAAWSAAYDRITSR